MKQHSDNETKRPGAFRFSNRMERRIVRRVGEAVGNYALIDPGDRIMVAVSGGKDSLALLTALARLGERSPVPFELLAVTIHHGNPAFSTVALEEHYRARGFAYHIEHVPIQQIVAEKLSPKSTPCALCSRIRRGVLYTLAPKLGCNKIALGHHLDDLIETLLLNLFYAGQLRSMSPRLTSDDGRNIVIRPLCYVPEDWLREYCQQMKFPVTTCATTGCEGADVTRQRMKRLVREVAVDHPRVRWHALRALRHVRPEHLLDRELLERLRH